MKFQLFPTLLLLFAAACTRPEDAPPLKVEGLRPVYATEDELKIEVQTPRPMRQLGKIYYKAPWLFAVETGAGIQVVLQHCRLSGHGHQRRTSLHRSIHRFIGNRSFCLGSDQSIGAPGHSK
jgi:hypothetical protein